MGTVGIRDSVKIGQDIGREAVRVIIDVRRFAGICDELREEAESLAVDIRRTLPVVKKMTVTEHKGLDFGIRAGIRAALRQSGCRRSSPLSGSRRSK